MKGDRKALVADAMLLALLLILLAMPTLDWVARWRSVPVADGAFHLLNALSVQAQWVLGTDSLDRLRPVLLWTEAEAYPLLGYLVPAALGAGLGGLQVTGLMAAQAIWIGLAGLGAWSLGSRLFGRAAGLLAALCTLFAPPLLAHLSDFLLDTASAACVVLSLAALARAWTMDRPGAAVLAGLGVAAAVLAKWTACFFLAPAVLVCAVQVFGQARRAARVGLGGLLALLVVLLGGGVALAQAWPPLRDPMTPWVPLETGLAWLVGVAAVALILDALARRLLGDGPPRNLVLALLTAAAVASPFYLWNLSAFERRLDLERDVHGSGGYRIEHLKAPLMQADAAAPMGSLVIGCALVWLAWRGPRGSFALIGAPLLVGVGCHCALKLVDVRYMLPAVPLAVLAVTGWLQTARETRAVSAAVLGAFGVWNLALWTGGLTTPEKPGPRPGTLPGSLDAEIARIVEVLGPRLGPEPSLLVADLQTRPFRAEALQVAFMERRFPVAVREVMRRGETVQIKQPRLAVLRFLMLVEPRRAPEELRSSLCDVALADVGQVQLLTVGTAEALAARRLPGTHGPVVELPAPAGLVARVGSYRPAPRPGPRGPDRPSSAPSSFESPREPGAPAPP